MMLLTVLSLFTVKGSLIEAGFSLLTTILGVCAVDETRLEASVAVALSSVTSSAYSTAGELPPPAAASPDRRRWTAKSAVSAASDADSKTPLSEDAISRKLSEEEVELVSSSSPTLAETESDSPPPAKLVPLLLVV